MFDSFPDHWEAAVGHTPDSLTEIIHYLKVYLLFDRSTHTFKLLHPTEATP